MWRSWLNNMSMSSFVDGEWQRKQLIKVTDGKLEAFVDGQSTVQVHVSQEESDVQGRTVVAVEAVIPDGQTVLISGVRLHLPLDQSLACTWKPHLAPLDDMTIGDKAFHSPAIVIENEQERLALIPDLEALQANRVMPHIMDYVIDEHELYYGLCDYEETGHVYYKLTPEDRRKATGLLFRFYLVRWEKTSDEVMRDYRSVEHFLWERFAGEAMTLTESAGQTRRLSAGAEQMTNLIAGREQMTNLTDSAEQMMNLLSIYPQYAYEWALDRWSDVCWQQFHIEGREVGGVVFIVTSKQKPGLGQEEVWREPKSLWNQAWFCSLRTAYGYWQAGQLHGRPDWVEKGNLALEFALSAPQTNGFFPSYYQAGVNGEWADGQWVMSAPRRPEGHEHMVHLLDSSWTCYWLLKWYRDIVQDERILPYVRNYVAQLVALQRDDGGFPAWVDPLTQEASPYLTVSPEAAMHALLLCLLHEIDAESDYIHHAEKACAFVQKHIVLEGRWEDFETYWSCSKQWEGKQYGVKDRRSGLYNQCSFGMYWTAEAFLALYKATGRSMWLDAGEQVLAEISLYQQIWEPHYLPVPTLGGFAVMTSDDEWNDARQSLFALTYYEYYLVTHNSTYLARSLWAMKASFYMMYCPENPEVMALYEKVHPHLNETDYGFHMENFNHHDGTSVNGLGEFTIFDWGCGAAAASYIELSKRMVDDKIAK